MIGENSGTGGKSGIRGDSGNGGAGRTGGPSGTVEQVGLVELVGLGEQMGLMDPETGSGIGTGEVSWICRYFGTFVANETGGTRCIGGKIGNGWQS